AALVDTETGALLGTATHRTTIDTDVLDGYDECLAALREQHPGVDQAEVLACSSAGGGLRVAVVGNEELVTAEAGRRVALSSGGKVVHVLALATAPDDPLAELSASAPDVVLLVGGTDGGNAEAVLAGGRMLAGAPWPIVVAGNLEARDAVAAMLATDGTPYVLADNVVPRIGVLAPESARAAIREMFLAHVIGGKHLSSRADFTAMVRGATPDLVLAGVELLALGLQRDVVVVDVGGATTDVHSVVELDPEDASLAREVVATTAVTRTVEGDLGMRWSAVSTVQAGANAAVLADDPALTEAARVRHDDPAHLPVDRTDALYDEQIARAATVLAVRRHAGRSRVVLDAAGRVVERSGKDLRDVGLLVGSGGVLRHLGPEAALRILTAATGTDPEGWQYPERPEVVVDRSYVLAAVGLLSEEHAEAAVALGRMHLHPPGRSGPGGPTA
ncbi:MAG: glutamate mutase L, partial [Actinomycetota bacterium]|nr:glutamate mutase L [Actinomycetota bacterium]